MSGQSNKPVQRPVRVRWAVHFHFSLFSCQCSSSMILWMIDNRSIILKIEANFNWIGRHSDVDQWTENSVHIHNENTIRRESSPSLSFPSTFYHNSTSTVGRTFSRESFFFLVGHWQRFCSTVNCSFRFGINVDETGHTNEICRPVVQSETSRQLTD
jgi:hypothetical protein